MKKGRKRSLQKRRAEDKLPIHNNPEEDTPDRQVNGVVAGQEREASVKQRVMLQTEMYQSPFPHPKHLPVYEHYCPGFLDRSLTMAEKANDSNIETNRRFMEYKIEDARRGMRYGFSAFIILIGMAFLCAWSGHDVIAGLFLGTGIVGSIGKFILGRTAKGEGKA